MTNPPVRAQVGHFMAFRTPLYNKLLCLFSNVPLVVPVATKFREYHHDHHIFMVRGQGGIPFFRERIFGCSLHGWATPFMVGGRGVLVCLLACVGWMLCVSGLFLSMDHAHTDVRAGGNIPSWVGVCGTAGMSFSPTCGLA